MIKNRLSSGFFVSEIQINECDLRWDHLRLLLMIQKSHRNKMLLKNRQGQDLDSDSVKNEGSEMQILEQNA